MGNLREIEDAEAFAALQGIKAAITLSTTRFSKDLWVFTDNEGVAKRLLTKTLTLTSQSVYLEALEFTKKWKSRARLPHIPEGKIKIYWVPSHAGISGNLLADSEARRGAAMLLSDQHQKHSLASLQKWQIAQIKSSRDRWWEIHAPRSYTQLEINSAPLLPKELHLSRRSLGQLIASRTGHGDFANYHTRFNHQNANLQCHCGSPKAQLHFFYCRILRRRNGRPPGPISSLIPNLLGTPEGAKKLTTWLNNADYFVNICPR